MLDSWYQSRVRGPRERFSGSVRGWVDYFGSVVQLLIWVNVIVFCVQLLCTVGRVPYVDALFALSGDGLRRGFAWQPLTYMFLHGGIWHILVNMFILWFFGREVEYFIGRKYFTRLYFIGGLAGAGLWLAFNFHSPVPVLGASAAVLACVIAFATLFPDRDITLLVFFVLPVTLKARYMALIAVAFDVVPLLSGTGTDVAHLAHLGGAAFGYLYIKQLGYGTTPRWLLALQRVCAALISRRQRRRRDLSSDESRSERDEYMRDVVDPILDKIAREGLQSLTQHEQQILESARELIEKKGQ